MNTYDNDNLFEFFHRSFNASELCTLCFRSPDFYPFYRDWCNRDVTLSVLIRELIDYAIRRNLVKSLLEAAKKQNPRMYEEFQREKSFYNLNTVGEIEKEESQNREDLIHFFKLREGNPTITIFLSRHAVSTQLPTFTAPSGLTNLDPAVDRLFEYEKGESENYHVTYNASMRKKFAVVSAIEMLESNYLKSMLEKSWLREQIPADELLKRQILFNDIKVTLSVCPEPNAYKQLLGDGTAIFIGGPRANLGAYYFLYGYGSKAGIVRPSRILKDVVTCIDKPQRSVACDSKHNLAIIQRHTVLDNEKTIFYLAGTGTNGTAAAIAYLRQNWLKLLDRKNENFAIVLEVPGGEEREEDFIRYSSEYWSDEKWKEVELICD